MSTNCDRMAGRASVFNIENPEAGADPDQLLSSNATTPPPFKVANQTFYAYGKARNLSPPKISSAEFEPLSQVDEYASEDEDDKDFGLTQGCNSTSLAKRVIEASGEEGVKKRLKKEQGWRKDAEDVLNLIKKHDCVKPFLEPGRSMLSVDEREIPNAFCSYSACCSQLTPSSTTVLTTSRRFLPQWTWGQSPQGCAPTSLRCTSPAMCGSPSRTPRSTIRRITWCTSTPTGCPRFLNSAGP